MVITAAVWVDGWLVLGSVYHDVLLAYCSSHIKPPDIENEIS